MSIAARLVVGQIKRFVSHKRGGFYLVWSESGRFRIYPPQFKTQPSLGQIVTFLPDERSSGNVRRVAEVLFEPSETDKLKGTQ